LDAPQEQSERAALNQGPLLLAASANALRTNNRSCFDVADVICDGCEKVAGHGCQTTLYDMTIETRTKGSKAYLRVITPNVCVGRGDDGYRLWYDRRQSDR
jgi:hypothetical protein